MAKLVLNNITSGFTSTTALNAAFDAIEAALENTVSRNGLSPNGMLADLDMNGNRILNQLAQAGDGFIWKGVWVTATTYALNNLVSNSGSSYICTVAHTSGVFGTDLGATPPKWQVLAVKADAVAGSGDMLKSENLSGLADYAVARTNMGLSIGSNVQAYDAQLGTLAAITATQATDLAALSPFMGTVLNDADAATARATLGAASKLDSWPVGSVFIAVVATNPNTLLGGGTWAAFGAGRVMVGLDAAQAEFDVVEEVGGAKTHTLSTAEMPSHTHGMPMSTDNATNAQSASVQGALTNSLTFNSNATGGGGAHNNLQPYIVCYFWKRTA